MTNLPDCQEPKHCVSLKHLSHLDLRNPSLSSFSLNEDEEFHLVLVLSTAVLLNTELVVFSLCIYPHWDNKIKVMERQHKRSKRNLNIMAGNLHSRQAKLQISYVFVFTLTINHNRQFAAILTAKTTHWLSAVLLSCLLLVSTQKGVEPIKCV